MGDIHKQNDNPEAVGDDVAADDTQDLEGTDVGEQGDDTDDPNEGESVEELRIRLQAAEERAERVKSESIKRRQRNSKITSERDGLMERVATLEAEAHAAKVQAAQATVVSQYNLPEEALELLGDDPDVIAKQAAALAKILETKSARKAPASANPAPISGREPSGGRVPQDKSNAVDMDQLIAATSRL